MHLAACFLALASTHLYDDDDDGDDGHDGHDGHDGDGDDVDADGGADDADGAPSVTLSTDTEINMQRVQRVNFM